MSKELKDILKEAREEKGLSLRELAKQADVSYAYLSKIEHGLRVPSDPKLQTLSKILDLSYADLKKVMVFDDYFSTNFQSFDKHVQVDGSGIRPKYYLEIPSIVKSSMNIAKNDTLTIKYSDELKAFLVEKKKN